MFCSRGEPGRALHSAPLLRANRPAFDVHACSSLVAHSVKLARICYTGTGATLGQKPELAALQCVGARRPIGRSRRRSSAREQDYCSSASSSLRLRWLSISLFTFSSRLEFQNTIFSGLCAPWRVVITFSRVVPYGLQSLPGHIL